MSPPSATSSTYAFGNENTVDPHGNYAFQQVLICDECGWVNIRVTFSPAADFGTAMDYVNEPLFAGPWFPESAAGREFPDVPSHIAEPASEAYRCFGVGAHRGAVMLARAVVEATAKDKEITDGKLFHKIEELGNRGLIRRAVVDAAHEIRHLGNDMAHGDFVEPISAEETEETLNLMSIVLDEVYQQPNRIAARKAARLAKRPGALPLEPRPEPTRAELVEQVRRITDVSEA